MTDHFAEAERYAGIAAENPDGTEGQFSALAFAGVHALLAIADQLRRQRPEPAAATMPTVALADGQIGQCPWCKEGVNTMTRTMDHTSLRFERQPDGTNEVVVRCDANSKQFLLILRD